MGVSNLSYYEGRYRGSLTDSQCEILSQLIELGEDNGSVPDLAHVIHDLSDETVDKMLSDFEEYGYLPYDYDKPIGTLRNYQTIAVAFMYYAVNCLLGDSVGMGKTVEVAGLCNLLKSEYEKRGEEFRYLMLTEKRPVNQVHMEMIKFTGDYCYKVVSAEEKNVNKLYEVEPVDEPLQYSIVGTHALLTSDGFISWLQAHKQFLGRSPFDILFIDESAVLAGKTTNKIVKSFKLIAPMFKRIVFMNATPIESSVMSIYNQLNLLDKSFLPTKTNFQGEYCIMRFNGTYRVPTNKYKNQAQFKEAIKLRYWASTRKGTGAIMDDCSGGVVLSDLSSDQKRLLKETYLNNMVYDCPSYIDDSIPFDEKHVPKLGSLSKLLDDECSEAGTIIMFVHYREAQGLLSKWLTAKGYTNRVLNGATSEKDGAEIVREFKEGFFRVLITNVQKGLNFGDCNYCIFYGFDTNPAKMVQFEGRITRSFDIVGKNVYILCSRGKEYKNLKEVVSQRASAMQDMAETDYSVLLTVLNRLISK